jgi:hypothetical protein
MTGKRDRFTKWIDVFIWAMLVIAVASAVVVMACGVDDASAAQRHPCDRHTGAARTNCLTAYHKHRARDALRFPPNPTMADVRKRVPDWWGFVRLGRCEQPGDGKWGVAWGNPGPTYGGGTGIYKGTWAASGSPYPTFTGSIPAEILTADAVRDRFGITAWGAWRCF